MIIKIENGKLRINNFRIGLFYLGFVIGFIIGFLLL